MNGRFIEVQCACCNRCTYDRLYGRCLYGGPFGGYRDPQPVDEAEIARTVYGVGPPDSYITKPDAKTIREVQEWAAGLTGD